MDALIVAALAEAPPPDTVSDRVQELWCVLQKSLRERRNIVASHTMEGTSYTRAVERIDALVKEDHAAYRQILGSESATPGTNPALLAKSRGWTGDFSHLQLHRL